MPHPQSRDIESRKNGRNAATPVFDPSLSPNATDAEAGGASTPGPQHPQDPATRHAPDDGSRGVRLTPAFWFAAAAAVALALIVAALLS